MQVLPKGDNNAPGFYIPEDVNSYPPKIHELFNLAASKLSTSYSQRE